ncbi:transglycosylase SLT domain-containing protein [Candidatus Fermentibacteria bacterium]|nr:transglycosylase SLT domain-containing protein [Candidatus Fermentibacteria bacterium]
MHALVTTRGLLGLALMLPCVSLAQPEIPTGKPPVSTMIIPETLALCGETLPLHRADVRERLEREFYFNLDREGQLVLYLKRLARTNPVVEPILREMNLPDDLKFVPVAESGLVFRAASAAAAVGYWQFVKGTALRYGLTVGTYVDERRDLAKSTRAAGAYLRDLHTQFGSWAVALGAYNWGENRMDRAIREQGTTSYYDLYLPDETDRFVFRIACMKLLLDNPQRHDLYLPEERLYSLPLTDEVEIRAKSSLHIAELAQAAAVSAREFRHLNQWMNANTLPAGTYRFSVPRGSGQTFENRLRQSSPAPASRPPGSAAVHVVRQGDSLTRIAMRYGVSLEDLERWNGVSRRHAIHPGQRLIVGSPTSGADKS